MKRKFKQTFIGRHPLAIIFFFAFCAGAAGLIYAYNQTRFLGFGDASPFLRFSEQEGSLYFSIGQNHWVFDEWIANIYFDILVPVSNLLKTGLYKLVSFTMGLLERITG